MAKGHLAKLEVKNLKVAQKYMLSAARALEPGGAGEAAIQFATLGAHRYMTTIVHVQTGRLKNSLFPEIDGLTGRIITNVNYAPFEEGRGGTHAFMERTEDEMMGTLAKVTLEKFGVAVTTPWMEG